MHDPYSDFSAKVTSVDGLSVVALSGEWDVLSKDALHDALSATGTKRDVVVDARDANFFDSSALAEFISFYKRATQRGKRFELLIGNSNLEKILEMTGLAAVLLPPPDRLAYLEQRITDNPALKRS